MAADLVRYLTGGPSETARPYRFYAPTIARLYDDRRYWRLIPFRQAAAHPGKRGAPTRRQTGDNYMAVTTHFWDAIT